MIRSMTGFAQVDAQVEAGRLSWELRSVNHRYLEVQFRLPEEFRQLEADLRARASAVLGRGKVEAALRFTRSAAATGKLSLDINRLRAVLDALGTISKEAGAATQPEALAVLSFPGVMETASVDQAPLLSGAASLFSAGLSDLVAGRMREGARLSDYLEARALEIRALTAQVRARSPLVRDGWHMRLRERMRELQLEIEPARLAQEAAIAAQRLDVDEEMSRLDGHVVELMACLRREDAVGRRLDFLMQELNREANTLSSKSQDAEMTRCAVEMKVLIEQMREQIQNIE